MTECYRLSATRRYELGRKKEAFLEKVRSRRQGSFVLEDSSGGRESKALWWDLEESWKFWKKWVFRVVEREDLVSKKFSGSSLSVCKQMSKSLVWKNLEDPILRKTDLFWIFFWKS